MDGGETSVGMESLRRLKSTDAPLFLSPSEELATSARIASQYLFSALKPFTSNSPLPNLLTEGFDAEQIWPQIETQSEPLIKTLKNQLKKFEKNPEEIAKQFNLVSADKKAEKLSLKDETKDFNGVEEDLSEEEEESDDEDGDEEEDDESDEEEEDEKDGIEDKFLKINEMKEYLKWDEKQEYGEDNKKKKRKRKGNDDEEEEEDTDDDIEFGVLGMNDEEDDENNELGNARYDDFFNVTKKESKPKVVNESDSSDMDDVLDGSGSDDSDMEDDDEPINQKKKTLSTHEKEQEKIRSEIEKMEKSNLNPKDWNMQGEINATKRGKNSALEVDLDFEHNVRPPPVITEEVTVSLEELIQKRILEERFDDVPRPKKLPSQPKKESKELDENKSKKGLAEVYEEEYVQKTGLVSSVLSFSDEQKKEASMLFKRLCLKLDALSHFHFTPKPVIEDMTIQANVPALAMEEIAPVAVSDAAMLAPEEVFSGKGDIKEETELSQAEKKRRRAKKKAKFKAETKKKLANKPKPIVTADQSEENKEA